MILLSTHNICLSWEIKIKKINYMLFSGGLLETSKNDLLYNMVSKSDITPHI